MVDIDDFFFDKSLDCSNYILAWRYHPAAGGRQSVKKKE